MNAREESGNRRGTKLLCALILAAAGTIFAVSVAVRPAPETPPARSQARVIVPPGASPGPAAIDLRPLGPPSALPPGLEAAGDSVEIDAHDVVFDQPVQVIIPFDRHRTRDLADSRLALLKESKGRHRLFQVPELSIDRERGLMTVEVRSFSTFTPVSTSVAASAAAPARWKLDHLYMEDQLIAHVEADKGPSCTITSPAPGARVSGIIDVDVVATDDIGVARVELLVNGTLVGTDATAPYKFSWNTRSVPVGTHKLSAKAYDTRGSVTTSPTVSVITSPVSATTGLVGHWKLDETSGIVAADASDYGRAGVVLGGARWTAGKVGGGLDFDGVDDRVSIASHADLQITGDLTIAFWMRKDAEATDWQRLVGKGDAVKRNYGVWEYGGASKKILFQQYDAAGAPVLNLTSAADVAVGVWTHVAAVVSGTTARIYINGTLDASGTRTGTPAVSADPVLFGYGNLHAHFPGALDDVQIHDRALSASELARLVGGSSFTPTLASDKAAYAVGEIPTYTLSGAAAGMPILWTTRLNGAVVQADFPNGTTNASGAATVAGGRWLTTHVGDWTIEVSVGGVESRPLALTVRNANAPTLDPSKLVYTVGETPVYTVTGAAASSPVLWTTTHNNAPAVTDFPQGTTSVAGTAVVAGGTWTEAHVGVWTVKVKIGGIFSNTVSITVNAAPKPTLAVNKRTFLVGEAPTYTVTGAAPNQAIYWSTWQNGNPVSSGFVNGRTDGAGRATITGTAWTAGHIGNWTAQIRIGAEDSNLVPFVVQGSTPTLTVNKSSFAIGETPAYTITGGLPSQPILWSTWRNGTAVLVGSRNGTTDATGRATIAGSPWSATDVGTWMVEVTVGGARSARITLTVGAPAPRLAANKTTYQVGEFPTYTINGAAANQSILWTTTRNGSPVGTDQANGRTDAAGHATINGSAWTAANVGTWTVRIEVLGASSNTLTLTVQAAGIPALAVNKTSFLVGESPAYTISGAAPNQSVLWTTTRNGSAVVTDQPNGTTNGSGGASITGGAWTAANVGTWTVRVKVAGASSNPITLTVNAAPPPVLAAAKLTYQVGETPSYTITGAAANQPVYWTTTHNGTPAATDLANGTTNASGTATIAGGTWTTTNVGTWTVRVKINNLVSNTVTLSVVSGTTPVVSSNKQTYLVGETPSYTITNAAANQSILWTTTRNGTPAATDLANGTTNASGTATIAGSTWTAGDVGTWTVKVKVSGRVSNTITLTVNAIPTPTLASNKSTYLVGETPLYTIDGATPNKPVFWTTTRNGTPVVTDFQNGSTDANGDASIPGGTWDPGEEGTWTVRVKVNGVSSSVRTLTVNAAPTPSLAADKASYRVGETPSYTITGAAPNKPVLWSTWLNGSPILAGTANGSTNSAGSATIPGGTWLATHVGSWRIQVTVSGSASNSVTFPVQGSTPTLSANKPSYVVGEAPVYTITGALPNQTVLWSTWLNGTPAAVNTANGTTDASGRATISGSTWLPGHLGSWRVQVSVAGSASNSVNFPVNAPVPTLTVNKATFTVGETPLYSIAGAAASQTVYWTTTHNGTPAATDLANGTTNASGAASIAGSTWTPANVGTWTVRVKVLGASSASLTITVVASPTPTLAANQGSYLVGQAPVYTISGAAPNQTILWSTWLNGSPIEAGSANGTTNGSGAATITGNAWQATHIGSWRIQVTVGGTASASLTFPVSAPTPGLTASKGSYIVGETPVYTITGALPNQTVYWSNWLNGAQTSADTPNGTTSASGTATIPGSTWAQGHVGSWQVRVKIGGADSNTISFPVSAPAPTLGANQASYRVGETPLYSVSGGSLNQPVLWYTWLNGVPAAAGSQNGSTNGAGAASIAGGTWQAGHAGSWRIQVSVAGVMSNSITFNVTSPTPTLGVNATSFAVGQAALYSITGALPNQTVYWSTWLNGTPIQAGAPNGTTDGAGNAAIASSPWQANSVGNWIIQVMVGGFASNQIALTVRAPNPTLSVNKGTFSVGETPLYTISGAAANQTIYWSNWQNGMLVGSGIANGNTGPSGTTTVAGGTWQSGHTGSWIIQVTVAGAASNQVGLNVFVPTPSLSSNQFTYQVGQTPMYTITNALPNQTVLWNTWLNGSLIQSGFPNGFTTPSGTATVFGGTWGATSVGNWLMQCSIGGVLSNTISFSVTAPPPPSLSISPNPVYRPASGTINVTYVFTVSGSPPDTGYGVWTAGQNLQSMGGYWSGNTFYFPWTLSSADAPGFHTYQVRDVFGRFASATLTVN